MILCESSYRIGIVSHTIDMIIIIYLCLSWHETKRTDCFDVGHGRGGNGGVGVDQLHVLGEVQDAIVKVGTPKILQDLNLCIELISGCLLLCCLSLFLHLTYSRQDVVDDGVTQVLEGQHLC